MAVKVKLALTVQVPLNTVEQKVSVQIPDESCTTIQRVTAVSLGIGNHRTLLNAVPDL